MDWYFCLTEYIGEGYNEGICTSWWEPFTRWWADLVGYNQIPCTKWWAGLVVQHGGLRWWDYRPA